MARDAFPGYDEPVNIDMEPEEAVRVLLGTEQGETTEEACEEATEAE
jgi:hypothetical protein